MCIQLVNVSKSYKHYQVIENCNLNIQHNGIYFICGESGCGKTTLLNMIAGYDDITTGERIIDNNLRISMLFQNFELIQELTVKENIYLYNNIFNNNSKESELIIDELGLIALMDCYPDELSHGQKQRVALARSLLCHSDVLLCDEPTESLDQTNKEIVMSLLKKISNDHIIIVVSHDENLMKNYYDSKYFIKDKKLLLVEENKSENIHIIENKKAYCKSKIFQTLFSLFIKNKGLYCFIITLLAIFLLVFSYAFVGVSNQDLHTLNDNVIYVRKASNGGKPSTVGKSIDKRIMFEFKDSIQVNNHKVYTSVFSIPLEYDDVHCLEGNINDQGIVINQFVASDIKEKLGKDDIIGEEVTITMNTNHITKRISLPISAIIHESDILKLSHIYYPYDLVVEELSHSFVVIEGQKVDAYTYYKKSEVMKYEVTYQLDENVHHCFQSMLKSHISCYSDVLQMLTTINYQRNMIQFVVISLFVLIYILEIVFIAIYNYKDLKKKYPALVILYSFSIPERIIHIYCYMIQLIMILISLSIATIFLFIFHQNIMILLNNILATSLTIEYPILIGLIVDIFNIIISIIVLAIIHRTLSKKTKISFFKES